MYNFDIDNRWLLRMPTVAALLSDFLCWVGCLLMVPVWARFVRAQGCTQPAAVHVRARWPATQLGMLMYVWRCSASLLISMVVTCFVIVLLLLLQLPSSQGQSFACTASSLLFHLPLVLVLLYVVSLLVVLLLMSKWRPITVHLHEKKDAPDHDRILNVKGHTQQRAKVDRGRRLSRCSCRGRCNGLYCTWAGVVGTWSLVLSFQWLMPVLIPLLSRGTSDSDHNHNYDHDHDHTGQAWAEHAGGWPVYLVLYAYVYVHIYYHDVSTRLQTCKRNKSYRGMRSKHL
jgi:hypothetical protein